MDITISIPQLKEKKKGEFIKMWRHLSPVDKPLSEDPPTPSFFPLNSGETSLQIFPKTHTFICKAILPVGNSVVSKSKSHAPRICSSVGNRMSWKGLSWEKSWDGACPGEGQLVRALAGYLQQLPKLPAKTIMVKAAPTSKGLCKSKDPDTRAPALT